MSSGLPKSEADYFQHIQRVKESTYLGIQIAGGQILLPILVLTVLFSKRVKRHPVFISFCISWILSSIIYSLLLYRGRSSDDLLSLNPSYTVCLVQASLISGIQAMTSCTNLTLVIHLWQLMRQCPVSEHRGMGFSWRSRKEMLFDYALLVTPYLIFISFTVAIMVIGGNPAETADGSGFIPGSNLSISGPFYCIILQNANFSHSLDPGLNILRSVVGFCCSISLITPTKKRTFLKRNTFNWMALFSRITLFSGYRIVAVILNIILIDHPDTLLLVGIVKNNSFNGVIDFFNAANPFIVLVVFASEKDIWSVWCFWRKEDSQAEENPSLASSEGA
ncbi:hypothetical protein ACEPAG_234 [Sanghuangporus baumii]